ncbi:MAG: DUF3987 domain-containing protein [Planctomycetes bacterium]|nr:DUF3987 domain-containing protein [Planctomycetota bacterium]
MSHVNMDRIPAALRERDQWIMWKYVERDGEQTKVPVQADGSVAKSNDPTTWAPFEEVRRRFDPSRFAGLGFVFSADDPFVGVDLDGCRDPETGKFAEWAREALKRFGSYAEVSPSGTGAKIFCRGVSPFSRGRKMDIPDATAVGTKVPAVEVYDRGRYFAVTGLYLEGPAEPMEGQDALAWLQEKYFPTETAPTTPSLDFRDDAAVTERARKYLARIPGAVSGQSGHNATFHAACVLVLGFELGESDAVALLTEWNQTCQPPWEHREIVRKVQEAAKQSGQRGYLRNVAPANWAHISVPRYEGAKPRNKSQQSPLLNGNQSGSGSIVVIPVTTSGGWEAPPSPLPTMPTVPRFPLSVFPAKVADYFQAVSEAMAAPPDYVAVPGLSLLGAAIGRSRAAEAKLGYAESPSFWTAVFAPPGATKSPNLRAAAAPLRLAETGWLESHRQKMVGYAVDSDRHGAQVKEWKSDGCEGASPTPPVKPILRQTILDDVTTESAAKVLLECPRGLVVVKDELLGFTRSLNAYKGGRGADREFWLSAWAGAPAKVNRSGNHDAGPLVITHPFIGVAGMLCPDSLAELRGELRNGDAPADGFLDRFLLSFPDPVAAEAEQWRTVPHLIGQGYQEVFANLLSLEMIAETHGTATRYRPHFIPFSQPGRAAWEEFTGNLADRMNALDPFEPFRGVLSKLRGYGLRFCALLWCLRHVCGDHAADASIGADIVVDADSLVTYFTQHADRCLGRGWADRTSRLAKRVVDWLGREPQRNSFTRTEAFRHLRDRRDCKSSDALTSVFKLLADHGFIRPVDREGLRPGPIPDLYAVNPQWVRSAVERRAA